MGLKDLITLLNREVVQSLSTKFTLMADINIYVSRIGQSNNLSLRDASSDPGDDTLTTSVDVNQTIQWSLDPTSDPGRTTDITLVSITKADSTLPKYANSQQLLLADPTVSNGVGNGTVVPVSPGSGKFENYTIGFTVNSDSSHTVQYDDPKLIMK